MAEPEVQMSTLVFLDFEATGLNNGKTKITELALLSVQREDLVTPYGNPRVVNKLTLCVNPMKPISMRASEITGLYNENLESQSPFDGQVIEMMVSYLTRLPQPVCLVAHYGNGFDFRLLADELSKQNKSLPDYIYCADSLEGFRELDGLSRTHVTPAKSSPNVTSVMSVTSETPIKSPQIETTDTPTTQNETPTKSSTCMILSSDNEVDSSRSSEGFNYSTPVGQHIPPDLDCPGIKERARLAKRKSDGDLHGIPMKAKACRKRLFESGGAGDDHDAKPLESENNDNKSNVASVKGEQNNMAQSQSVSDAASSKSDTINVASNIVNVKKKLDFENSNTSHQSPDVGNSGKCKVDLTEQDSDSCNFISKSSIPDDILLDAVQGLEENVPVAENESKSSASEHVCKSKEKDNYKSDEEEKRCNWYNKVVVQSVNTGMSYTLSKAQYHRKVDSYVTSSADHGHGPISSYEMNHKHFRSDNKQNVTDVTPKKETHSVEQKLYFSSENVNKKEMKKTLDNTGKEDNGERETTPIVSADSGNATTPVKSNQSINTTVDTPVSQLPPRLSYKLIEIYKRTFGHLPNVSHAAEDDCVSLMKVVKKRSPEFLHWIDKNAVLFSTIKPL